MKLPQLTLRDLFWLVLVIALSLGWWLQSRRHQELRERAELWEWRATTIQTALEAETTVTWDDSGLGITRHPAGEWSGWEHIARFNMTDAP
jgi:hypothetical protein